MSLSKPQPLVKSFHIFPICPNTESALHAIHIITLLKSDLAASSYPSMSHTLYRNYGLQHSVNCIVWYWLSYDGRIVYFSIYQCWWNISQNSRNISLFSLIAFQFSLCVWSSCNGINYAKYSGFYMLMIYCCYIVPSLAPLAAWHIVLLFPCLISVRTFTATSWWFQCQLQLFIF